jgi:hypothetical protein
MVVVSAIAAAFMVVLALHVSVGAEEKTFVSPSARGLFVLQGRRQHLFRLHLGYPKEEKLNRSL